MTATPDISKTPLANIFRNEGRNEERIESRRETLIDLGTEKFGEANAETASALEAVSDEARLRSLLKRLIHGSSWQELLTD